MKAANTYAGDRRQEESYTKAALQRSQDRINKSLAFGLKNHVSTEDDEENWFDSNEASQPHHPQKAESSNGGDDEVSVTMVRMTTTPMRNPCLSIDA